MFRESLTHSGHTWRALTSRPNISPASKITHCSLEKEIVLCLVSRLLHLAHLALIYFYVLTEPYHC